MDGESDSYRGITFRKGIGMFFSCVKQEKNQKKFTNLQFDRLRGLWGTARQIRRSSSQTSLLAACSIRRGRSSLFAEFAAEIFYDAQVISDKIFGFSLPALMTKGFLRRALCREKSLW